MVKHRDPKGRFWLWSPQRGLQLSGPWRDGTWAANRTLDRPSVQAVRGPDGGARFEVSLCYSEDFRIRIGVWR